MRCFFPQHPRPTTRTATDIFEMQVWRKRLAPNEQVVKAHRSAPWNCLARKALFEIISMLQFLIRYRPTLSRNSLETIHFMLVDLTAGFRRLLLFHKLPAPPRTERQSHKARCLIFRFRRILTCLRLTLGCQIIVTVLGYAAVIVIESKYGEGIQH